MARCVVVVSWFAAGSGGAAAAVAVAAVQQRDGDNLVVAAAVGGDGVCQLPQLKYENYEKICFLEFVVTQENWKEWK